MKKSQSKKRTFFVYCVISCGIFIYFSCIFFPWIAFPEQNESWDYLYLIFAHCSLFLFFWSLMRVLLTDPGKVPSYWGLFLNDGDFKKRRYCLICHVFKPERCHHCSTCERCVLNMDHHCPWINNCVGFFNRKYFVLMLFYAVASGLIIFSGTLKLLWIYTEDIIKDFDSIVISKWILISFATLGFLIDTVLFVMVFLFFLTHIRFVLTNYTTIENLDHMRQNPKASKIYSYDRGYYNNWIQVFGRNPYLWLVPSFCESGRPIGDGVNWIIKRDDFDENDKVFHENHMSKPNEKSEKNTPREEGSKINQNQKPNERISPREEQKQNSERIYLADKNKIINS